MHAPSLCCRLALFSLAPSTSAGPVRLTVPGSSVPAVTPSVWAGCLLCCRCLRHIFTLRSEGELKRLVSVGVLNMSAILYFSRCPAPARTKFYRPRRRWGGPLLASQPCLESRVLGCLSLFFCSDEARCRCVRGLRLLSPFFPCWPCFCLSLTVFFFHQLGDPPPRAAVFRG